MSIFEQATRNKVRFSTERGLLSVEDLWDLPLNALNKVAQALNKQIKTAEEEDFLKATPTADESLVLGFDVTLHILNVKKQEKADVVDAIKRRKAEDKLLGALARRQDEKLDNMTEAQIKKAIKAL